MVGLICSRIPAHIWRGMVRCSNPDRNKTATISSKDVTKAKRPPETTPGRIKGIITFRQVVTRLAPRLVEARIRLPLGFLSDREGRTDAPIELEAFDDGQVTASWRDGNVPQRIRYEPE